MNKYASCIDHTILKPDTTNLQIKKLCLEAMEFNFYSVCVNPSNIELAKEYLKDSNVKVCTVVGFPLGANDTDIKVLETVKAIEKGAEEIDFVINVAKLKDKEYEYLKREITSIVNVCEGKALTKGIIETCLLNEYEIEQICNIFIECGVDFVKTSTGFSKNGVTLENINFMKKICDNKIKIKASGGINNFEFMNLLINAGADRIGTSHGVEIMQEIAKKSTKDGEM